MRNFKQPWGILFIYSLSVAVSAAWVLGGMLSAPSEAERAVVFGLSSVRLVVVVGLLAAFTLFVGLAFKAFQDHAWAEQFVETWFKGKKLSQWTAWLGSLSFGLGWIGCFLPEYRLGVWSGYWERIQSVMVFVLIAGLATLIVLFVVRIKNLNLAPLRLGLPLFVVCLLLLGVMFYSGFGVLAAEEDYWYGTGVPILWNQLSAAIAGGIFLLHFGSRWISKRVDLLICVLIFAVTAFLWSQSPLRKSFLFTDPYLPNNVFYPFADSAIFDMASQFALIGQKLFIFNNFFFERPLYLSFLVYLHVLFGQDYELLMAIQAAVFAIFPVIIYLIGRSLQVRAIGLASAIVILFRGINSISASNLMDTANPKMILTDFPTAIGVALVTLMTCEWLAEPEKRRHYALWIGGGIGFTAMLRTNALILLAFIPFLLLFVYRAKWRQWVFSSFMILLGVIAITLPWEIRNQSLGGQMYGPIVAKFQSVIQQRYPSSAEPNSIAPQEYGFASLNLKSTEAISRLYQDSTRQNSVPCNSVLCFSTNHFLHNTLTSILILPTSPLLDDLRHLIRERHPYWQVNWDGSLGGDAPFFLVLNLFFITTGIARAWKERQIQGLTPLVIFIAYNLSNALARTSGGRYLVPIDWILIFYYLLGIFQVITWLGNVMEGKWDLFNRASENKPSDEKTSFSKSLGIVTILLIIGALLPLSETLYLPRYQNADPLGMLAGNRSLVEATGLKMYDLDSFLQSPNADILVGRALYPRFYKMNQGEFAGAFYPYHTLGFPRTAFKLIGPAGEYSVVLPGDIPEYLPHASDVLVLGCQQPNYFDALVVIVLDGESTAYARRPEAPLQCPLQQPVCNNNSVCQ
jgi:hypothetical protein